MPAIAGKDLDEFNQAAQRSNLPKVGQLLDALVSTIRDAQKNNEKIVPVIGKMISAIQSLANSGSWFGKQGLKVLVKAVNGNRDNRSYYTLDAAREWIARRLEATTGTPVKSGLEGVQDKVVIARDLLDSMAQNFVSGIKNLVALTAGDMNANVTVAAIHAQAANMTEDWKRSDSFTVATQDALTSAQAVQDAAKSGPSSVPGK